MDEFASRRVAFRALHERSCFVIPNPWDVGTARALQHGGFRALATTSAGFAFSRGLPDNAPSRDAVLAHVREIARATHLPVNADFQAGFATDASGVEESVRLCVEAGAAGLSIEDATGDARAPLYELPRAVERLRAARAAIDASGTGTVLTGRAECHLVGHPDPLRESIRRLQAYADAGADVLYAPGVRDRADIETIVKALAPKPVNVLLFWSDGLSVKELADIGVRRVSVGSLLARVAWGAFLRASKVLATPEFSGFDGAAGSAEMNDLFREYVDPD